MIPQAIAPHTKAPTMLVPPIATRTASATSTHTTPDRVPNKVFWRPGTPPPAAKKQPRATTPAQTDRFKRAVLLTQTQTATKSPTKSARAVLAFIGCLHGGWTSDTK